MERACERVYGSVLPGKKRACADWLAGWLACWLAGLLAGWLADLIDTNYFHHRAMHDAPCDASRGLHGRQTTGLVVGHLAKAILRSVRSRDDCFLRAREGEVQSLACLGPGLDLAARATQARPARGG